MPSQNNESSGQFLDEDSPLVPLQIKTPPKDVIEIVAHARCKMSLEKGGKEISKQNAMIELIRRGNMGVCGEQKEC